MGPVGCVLLTFLLTVYCVNDCYCQSLYDVRLVGGTQYNEGRVEVYYNYRWNTICDDIWGLDEAQVVCRQLGYGANNVVARSDAYFGPGSGSIQQINCYGWESRLSSCTFTSGDSACGHYKDAGVECGDYTTTYDPFQWLTTFDYYGNNNIRLVDGYSSSEGRVEIYYNYQWNTICDDNWGLDEAEVVCRQLGYGTDNVVARSSAYYGQGSGPIRRVECFGWEYSLRSCTLTSATGYCFHYEDAGVDCGYLTTSSRVIGVMSFVGVSLFLLTIVATVAVCYTCTKQRKPSPTAAAAVEMQPMSTVTTTPPIDTSTTAPLQVNVPV